MHGTAYEGCMGNDTAAIVLLGLEILYLFCNLGFKTLNNTKIRDSQGDVNILQTIGRFSRHTVDYICLSRVSHVYKCTAALSTPVSNADSRIQAFYTSVVKKIIKTFVGRQTLCNEGENSVSETKQLQNFEFPETPFLSYL